MPGLLRHLTTLGESAGTEAVYRFDQISDADLLASTQRLVGRSNQLLSALLAHLAEVEAPGIHRLRACASLYNCVFELRLSEDAAFRRARGARIARRFPIVFQQVAEGELHLTALVLLAPHLTEENHRELLARAKHRTKREILSLVRALAPEPTVPDRVEPLGPEPVGIPMPGGPTWRTLVESLASTVRELPPGQRPKDWLDGAGAAADEGVGEQTASAAADTPANIDKATIGERRERFKVQFTASQEYVGLLGRAQDLLSHAVPDRSLEAVHLRALRLLVDQLEKRKYGARRLKAPPGAEPAGSAGLTGEQNSTGAFDSETAPRTRQSKKHTHATRQRGAAAVRREVRDRDGLQCTFVDGAGRRCTESRFLEVHHIVAYARGGRETPSNLTLYCRAHNTLAAEQDFGREFMRERRSGA